MKHTLYNTFDSLPIYNWHKYVKTNDIRYIIANVDVNQLPQLTEPEKNLLKQSITNLVINSEKIDFSIQKSFLNAMNALNDYLQSPNNLQKYNVAFNKYLDTLNAYYNEFTLEKYTGSDIKVIYNLKRNEAVDLHEFTTQRLFFFYYDNIEMSNNTEFDLYEILANLLVHNNIQIDEFTCSVRKFENIMKTVKIMNELKHKKNT